MLLFFTKTILPCKVDTALLEYKQFVSNESYMATWSKYLSDFEYDTCEDVPHSFEMVWY